MVDCSLLRFFPLLVVLASFLLVADGLEGRQVQSKRQLLAQRTGTEAQQQSPAHMMAIRRAKKNQEARKKRAAATAANNAARRRRERQNEQDRKRREQQRAEESRKYRARVREEEIQKEKERQMEEQAKEDAKSPEQKAREKAEREAKKAEEAKKEKEREEGYKQELEERQKAQAKRDEEYEKARKKREAEEKAQVEAEEKARANLFAQCTAPGMSAVDILNCFTKLGHNATECKSAGLDKTGQRWATRPQFLSVESEMLLRMWAMHEDFARGDKEGGEAMQGLTVDEYNAVADALLSPKLRSFLLRPATKGCEKLVAAGRGGGPPSTTSKGDSFGTNARVGGIRVLGGSYCLSGAVADFIAEINAINGPTGLRRDLAFHALEGAIALGDHRRAYDYVSLKHGAGAYLGMQHYVRFYDMTKFDPKGVNFCEEVYQTVMKHGVDVNPCRTCIEVATDAKDGKCAYCDKGGRNGHSCFSAKFEFGLPRCAVLGNHWMDTTAECPAPAASQHGEGDSSASSLLLMEVDDGSSAGTRRNKQKNKKNEKNNQRGDGSSLDGLLGMSPKAAAAVAAEPASVPSVTNTKSGLDSLLGRKARQ